MRKKARRMRSLGELEAFITAGVEQMVQNKLILQRTDASVSAQDISQEMIRILHEFLGSEREQYLQQCLARLGKINSDRDELEREFFTLRDSHRRKVQRLVFENESLRSQRQELESAMEATERKQFRREDRLKNSLIQQEHILVDFHSILDSANVTKAYLKQKTAELHTAVDQMKRRQMRLIRQARDMCDAELDRVFQRMMAAQKRLLADQVAQLRQSIERERAEQSRLESVCESILNDVWSITPKGLTYPDISVADFPDRVRELQQFVEMVMEFEHREAEPALKSEIQAAIPGMEFGRSEAVSVAVDRYISEKLAEKEREYEAVLQEGREREKKLKRKIDRALRKIRELQAASQGEGVVDDVPGKQSAWLEQKQILDKTMEALERERTSNSSYLKGSSSFMKSLDSDDSHEQ
jgi:hypothetical protein